MDESRSKVVQVPCDCELVGTKRDCTIRKIPTAKVWEYDSVGSRGVGHTAHCGRTILVVTANTTMIGAVGETHRLYHVAVYITIGSSTVLCPDYHGLRSEVKRDVLGGTIYTSTILGKRANLGFERIWQGITLLLWSSSRCGRSILLGETQYAPELLLGQYLKLKSRYGSNDIEEIGQLAREVAAVKLSFKVC